jgi:hypothetical protein
MSQIDVLSRFDKCCVCVQMISNLQSSDKIEKRSLVARSDGHIPCFVFKIISRTLQKMGKFRDLNICFFYVVCPTYLGSDVKFQPSTKVCRVLPSGVRVVSSTLHSTRESRGVWSQKTLGWLNCKCPIRGLATGLRNGFSLFHFITVIEWINHYIS